MSAPKGDDQEKTLQTGRGDWIRVRRGWLLKRDGATCVGRERKDAGERVGSLDGGGGGE